MTNPFRGRGILVAVLLSWLPQGPAGAPSAGAVPEPSVTLPLRKDAAGRWLIASDMDNGNFRR